MTGIHEILESHIERNIPEYLTFLAALAIAAVCTMPEKCPLILGPVNSPLKEAIQDMWCWLRNALQTAIPAARRQNPTPPANPAYLNQNPNLKEGKQ